MNGTAEAYIIAIACSEVSEGRDHWTLQMIADELVDHHYRHCEKIVLVMDKLNIHSTASLYRAFESAEAHRIASRLETSSCLMAEHGGD